MSHRHRRYDVGRPREIWTRVGSVLSDSYPRPGIFPVEIFEGSPCGSVTPSCFSARGRRIPRT
jgi:hypothetical protein